VGMDQGLSRTADIHPVMAGTLGPMSAAALSLLLLGIAIDTVSLVLGIARLVRGHGASGIPVVSWLIYGLTITLLPIDVLWPLILFLGLTAYHLLVHFGISWLYWRRWADRR
jgi:hypothetical protein